MSDPMQPGPELDRMIAERVMGWHAEWGGDDLGGVWAGQTRSGRTVAGWHPSTNVRQAFEVVEQMKEMGYAFKLCDVPSFSSTQPGPGARFLMGVYAPRTFRVIIGKTAAHAICLAALKAIGDTP